MARVYTYNPIFANLSVVCMLTLESWCILVITVQAVSISFYHHCWIKRLFLPIPPDWVKICPLSLVIIMCNYLV